MALILPEIKHEYLFHLDTEETKNSVFDQCRAEGKEAAYSTFGTAQNDSEYQPAPTVNLDYYMEYCSSDGYDYLKDYRLVWGYSIGIIEQDVICSLTTGEHLAEGKEACDTYEAENVDGKDTDWKRGIWIKFSGNRNISPTRIGEVVLPERVISLKDLCGVLNLRSYTVVEGFNSNNIINIDRAFAAKYIDTTNAKTFNFSNILSANYTFQNTHFYNQNPFSFSNVNDIDYYYTFQNSNIDKIPIGFENVGGRYCYANSEVNGELKNINAKLYTHQYEDCNITKVDESNTFIAQKNVDYAFSDNKIGYFSPTINWNLTTSAVNFIGDVINECIYNIDFTTLNNNITTYDFINNESLESLIINIIASNDYKINIDNGTTNMTVTLFKLRKGDSVNITNTLSTVYKYNNYSYIFGLINNDVTIIGKIDTIQLIYVQSENNVFIGNNSNIILSNSDTEIKSKSGLIKFAGGYSDGIDIKDFNINRINFDNCGIINFTYDSAITGYKMSFYDDINVVVNTTKDEIDISGFLVCNFTINLKDNTKVKILANHYSYDGTYQYHINKNATLTLVNDNNTNDVNLRTTNENKNIGIKYYINTNNNIVVDSLNIDETIDELILIDNCKQLIINLNNPSFSQTNIVRIINKYCTNIKLDNAKDTIYKLYTLEENIQYTIISDCIDDYNNTYENVEFVRDLAYAHTDVETAKNIPLPTFVNSDGEDVKYLYHVNNLDNVPYEYLLRNITNNGHIFICNHYTYTGLDGNIIVKSIDCSNQTLYLESFNNNTGNKKYISCRIDIYDDETFNCIFNGTVEWTAPNSYMIYWNNFNIINPIQVNSSVELNNILNDEIILQILYNIDFDYVNTHLKESCNNVTSLIINSYYVINNINIDDYFNDKLHTLYINMYDNYTMNKDLNLSLLSLLSQESINSIVNPSIYKSGATLTINTIPFQYITEEQKQALVNAGVTLVEYIPQTE